MDLMLDHLTVEEKNEVFMITQQMSPLEMEPTNMAEFAFLNEEIHRESREEMERQQDQERWDRLIALGVILAPDDEIYDWEQLEQSNLAM